MLVRVDMAIYCCRRELQGVKIDFLLLTSTRLIVTLLNVFCLNGFYILFHAPATVS